MGKIHICHGLQEILYAYFTVWFGFVGFYFVKSNNNVKSKRGQKTQVMCVLIAGGQSLHMFVCMYESTLFGINGVYGGEKRSNIAI